MNPQLDLVIVIPIGPSCKLDYIADTIDSIRYYIRCTYQIIIADDSQITANSEALKRRFPEIIVLRNKKNHGKALGLYKSLSNAYRYALDQFGFDALLRLDTDALIIGPDPEKQIIELFKKDPSIGLAGRYVKGLRSPDDFGNTWVNGGRELIVAIAKIFSKFYLKHPITYLKIRRLIFQAVNHGYELGDLVFGGAYAFSRLGLENLRDHGLLPMKAVHGTELEEDHVFSILISAVGLALGDLASGDQPFACTWRGLPASPETLLISNKKIIHSTRYWQDIREDEIRKFFREQRT